MQHQHQAHAAFQTLTSCNRCCPPTKQFPRYASALATVPHIAWGEGLHEAAVGTPASFTIQLVGEDGGYLNRRGSNSPQREEFIYVWISNEDQVGAFKV